MLLVEMVMFQEYCFGRGKSLSSAAIRSFEKGLADRGGWRQDILPMPEIEASFLHPFSYAPLGEEGHFWRTLLPALGVVGCPPPTANPFLSKTKTLQMVTLQVKIRHQI